MGDKRIIDPPPYRRDFDLRVVTEIPSPTLGAVLWRALSKVLLWAGTPVEERNRVFIAARSAGQSALLIREARDEEPLLEDALEWLDLFTRSPLAVNPEKVAEACCRVAVWAESNEYTSTSLHFAEAAAQLNSRSPQVANLAARLTRNAAEFDRAELWFSRAIGLARANKEWIQYTRAHIGLGVMWQTMGKDRRARAAFAAAASRAMRDGREWLASEAQHDLMLMAAERGFYSEAEEHARRALAWYPKNNERLPFLIADIAFLLTCEQEHQRALTVVLPFFRAVKAPARQVLALSVLARALGGLREPRFSRVRRRLLGRLTRFKDYEAAARINLAEGERAAGLWNEAEENARIAYSIARAAGDKVPERLARQLLIEIRSRTTANQLVRRTDEHSLAALVELALRRLGEWIPTQRGRRPRDFGEADWRVA
jgi:tetratricopeptide (TPR) repeat protein